MIIGSNSWPIQDWPKVKHVIKGILKLSFKQLLTWGINHLSRNPLPDFPHPLGKQSRTGPLASAEENTELLWKLEGRFKTRVNLPAKNQMWDTRICVRLGVTSYTKSLRIKILHLSEVHKVQCSQSSHKCFDNSKQFQFLWIAVSQSGLKAPSLSIKTSSV